VACWFWNGVRFVQDGTVTVHTPRLEDDEDASRREERKRALRQQLGME
jgi:hypothetical protein